jgi:hypothetical protein
MIRGGFIFLSLNRIFAVWVLASVWLFAGAESAYAGSQADIVRIQKGLSVPSITLTQADRAFSFLQQLPIAHKNMKDGCEARAYLYSFYLEKVIGIQTAKVFVHSRRSSGFRVKLTDHPERYINWNYHVAPLFRLEDGELYVFDATLFDRPMLFREWRARLDEESDHVFEIYHTDRFAYMNAEMGKTKEWRLKSLNSAWNTVFGTTASGKIRSCAKKIQPVVNRFNLDAVTSEEILLFDSREGTLEFANGSPLEPEKSSQFIFTTATEKELKQILDKCKNLPGLL